MEDKDKNLTDDEASEESAESIETDISEEPPAESADDEKNDAEADESTVTGGEGSDEEAVPESESGEAADGEAAESEEKKKPDFKKLKKKAADFIKGLGFPDMLLVRFIAVYFFISGLNISMIGKENIKAVDGWRDFIPKLDGTRTVFDMLIGFILLTVIYRIIPKRWRFIDQLCAISGILYFDIVLLWRAADAMMSIAVMLVSVVFIYYAFAKIKPKKLLNKIPAWACLIVAVAAAVLVGWFIALTTICRHRNFGSATHDFGLFVQMYYSLAKDLTAVTTCERDTPMSHFLIHASYIFYALVPFYKLFPHEETLLIAQAVLAMGGVIPMFLIAKRHNMKGLTLIFMSLAYVFCAGLIGPCYYEFHENAFLPTLLMWLLWAVDGKKYTMFYIMSALVCIVKEDAPLYVVCIGLFMFFSQKGDRRRLHGIIMAFLAGSYMMFITDWLVKNGDGQMMTSTRFGLLMINYDAGLREVVKNVLADPAYFFSLLIKEDTLLFFLEVMAPMLFLPFFTKKIHRYLLMLPFIITNMVVGAGYGYAASIGFQYIFGPACLLLYMCIINLDDMGQTKKQEIPVLLGCAALILSMGLFSRNIGYYESNKNDSGYFVSLDEMLDRIPQDASVACDTFLLPHIADRDEVYIFDNNDLRLETDPETEAVLSAELVEPEKYDFFVVPVGSDLYNNALPEFERLGITLYDEIPGRIQVYVSPDYVPSGD